MKTHAFVMAFIILAVASGCGTTTRSGARLATTDPATSEWQEDFDMSDGELVPTGRNPYFILEPGFQLTFASADEKLIITVLNETVKIGKTTARVVEEREWKDGKLVEVSRNFFAICPETMDVFYFGEEVDDYKNGKIGGHGGAWRADQPGNKPGLIMPGSPKVGMKYYQEIAPGVAMDRAQVVSLRERLKTPAGTFENCLKTQEGSALKPREKEFKIYASRIGLLKDGDMLLTKYGFLDEK
ncbi:MAG: hypothetical protein R6V03_02375 [Kiritimatiellia bacterium]